MKIFGQLSPYFSGGKCVTWKNRKKTMNIYDTIQPIFMKFLAKWLQCV